MPSSIKPLLTDLPGVGVATAQRLKINGFGTVEAVARAPYHDLAAVFDNNLQVALHMQKEAWRMLYDNK